MSTPIPSQGLDLSADLSYAENGGAVIGVDEVGRGPLAGPVMAAAVFINPHDEAIMNLVTKLGLDDSKRLSAKKRQYIMQQLIPILPYALGAANVKEIADINILHASHLAMRRAIMRLKKILKQKEIGQKCTLLIDGKFIPDALPNHAHAIIKGDQKHLSIAAASIIAKETRDRLMINLAKRYPEYQWERNAGYGVKAHLSAIKAHGITPHHRYSFAPIRDNYANGVYIG